MAERWAVVLDGNFIDLKSAARCFGHAGSRPVRIGTIDLPGGRTLPALFADSFGMLSRHEDVQGEARRLLAVVDGILFVGDQGREPSGSSLSIRAPPRAGERGTRSWPARLRPGPTRPAISAAVPRPNRRRSAGWIWRRGKTR